MLKEKLKDHRLLLASRSPRRKQLLSGLDIPFEVIYGDVDEVWPEGMELFQIPKYLAELKANALKEGLSEKDIILTSDTAVFFENEILNKPKDRKEAFEMIKRLSGNKHSVITGVCIMSSSKRSSFDDRTEVFFRELKDDEINYYLDHYEPYDKAGSYGAQDWIGYIGIEKLEGSYYNVMGLPVRKVYSELRNFV